VSKFLYGANVAANGIRQHYLRYGGKGSPLVLLPGITSPATTWSFVAERLAGLFDTYIFDARGRGLSSGGKDLDYGIDALADDLASALDALQLTNVLLMGHSMGARTAIRAARRHPLPIRRLVLVDPPVSGPGRRPYPSPLPWYIESIRMAAKGCGIEHMRPYLPTWSDEQLRLRAEWLHTCEEAAIVRSYHDLNEADVHADLPHIHTPTLLIVAGGADVVRPEESAEMVRLCPALSVRTVINAGHMIPWDNFEGFFAALLPFLESDRR
jgi:N-formylmaleamate deformylase